MTIKVTATCAWCQIIKDTDIKTPVPQGWTSCEVISPEISKPSIEENFCCKDHKNHYEYYSPYAHEAASKDYTSKFYAEMNVLRKKETDSPREIVKEISIEVESKSAINNEVS